MKAVNTPASVIDNGICIPTAALARGGHRFCFFVVEGHGDTRVVVKDSSFSMQLFSVHQGFAASQDGSA